MVVSGVMIWLLNSSFIFLVSLQRSQTPGFGGLALRISWGAWQPKILDTSKPPKQSGFAKETQEKSEINPIANSFNVKKGPKRKSPKTL